MSHIALQVRQLMTSPVVKVSPTTPVTEAADKLLRHGLFAMPVVADGTLVGVVDEPALFRATATLRGITPEPTGASEDTARPTVVADVMRRPVTWVKTTDSLQLAATVLSRQERVLPVLDHGRVVGMLSRSDLLPVMTGRRSLSRPHLDGVPMPRRQGTPPPRPHRPRLVGMGGRGREVAR